MSFAAFGLGALAQGVGDSMSLGTSFLKGAQGMYFSKKQAALQYRYQKKFAENSPSWNVAGLRKAGLNPILAAGGGYSPSTFSPSPAPQSSTHPNRLDPLTLKQLELLDSQIEGQKIKNVNDSMNRGLSGSWGATSRVISEAQKAFGSNSSAVKESVNSLRAVKQALGALNTRPANTSAPPPDYGRDDYDKLNILREKYGKDARHLMSDDSYSSAKDYEHRKKGRRRSPIFTR